MNTQILLLLRSPHVPPAAAGVASGIFVHPSFLFHSETISDTTTEASVSGNFVAAEDVSEGAQDSVQDGRINLQWQLGVGLWLEAEVQFILRSFKT